MNRSGLTTSIEPEVIPVEFKLERLKDLGEHRPSGQTFVTQVFRDNDPSRIVQLPGLPADFGFILQPWYKEDTRGGRQAGEKDLRTARSGEDRGRTLT